MSYDELAQEMWKHENSLEHLQAKAKMARRAALQGRVNGWVMLTSVIIAFLALDPACVKTHRCFDSRDKILVRFAGGSDEALR